MQELMMEANLH